MIPNNEKYIGKQHLLWIKKKLRFLLNSIQMNMTLIPEEFWKVKIKVKDN